MRRTIQNKALAFATKFVKQRPASGATNTSDVSQLRSTELNVSDPVHREQILIQSAGKVLDRGHEHQALELLTQAEHLGLPNGAFNLGLFFDGKFGQVREETVDHRIAAFFYARASKMGHVAAQTNLGILHALEVFDGANKKLGVSLLIDSIERGDKVASHAVLMIHDCATSNG